MSKISTLFLAAASLFFAPKAFSQSTITSCAQINVGACDRVEESFTTDPKPRMDYLGFVWTGAQASNQNLAVSNVTPSTTYNLTTPPPGYVLAQNGRATVGFTLGTGTGSNDYFANGNTIHLTLQVFSADLLTVLAQCDMDITAAGSYCIAFVDASLSAGQLVRYRFNFTSTATTSTTGGGPLLTLDNITAASNSQAPLPVKFYGLAAKAVASGVELTWKVGAEEKLSGYDIERSTDGIHFAKVGFVAASNKGEYTFTDASHLPTVYYRVKSMDIDGKFGYSTIVALQGNKTSVVVKAFMSERNTLTVQHDAAEAGSRVLVSSIDGRTIATQVVSPGVQQTRVDMAAAPAGLYIVRFDNGSGTMQTIKVVKQ